jgi:hypothetical protein
MVSRSGKYHLLGCLAVLAVAVVLLVAVFPVLVSIFMPKTSRLAGLRGEAVDFLFVALVPVLVWVAPPLVRGLARLTHRGHKALLGKSGFYVRFPTHRPVRFRDTLVQALSPFAIDLLVISEIEYFVSGADASTFTRGLFAFPFLLLAGIVTSLLPGPWLVDAMDLRLVNPSKGEAVREASVFEGFLGPIGALALLVSFITLVHTVGDSYEQGLVLLGLWAARMFPAVLVAVSVYRVFIEPDVLPGLEKWAEGQGIPVILSLESALAGLRPAPPRSTPERPVPAPGDAQGTRDPPA